jgi:hypothetical protein
LEDIAHADAGYTIMYASISFENCHKAHDILAGVKKEEAFTNFVKAIKEGDWL